MTRTRVALATVAAVVVVVVAAIATSYTLRADTPPERSASIHSPSSAPPSIAVSVSPTESVSATGTTAAAEVFGAAPPAAAGQEPDTSLGAVRRSRYVSFEAGVLPQTADGRRLVLNFFDDASFVGTVEHLDRQPQSMSWSGPLDEPRSLFVITQAGDRYQVTASTTQGSFTMNRTLAGLYQVAEVRQPDGVDIPAP